VLEPLSAFKFECNWLNWVARLDAVQLPAVGSLLFMVTTAAALHYTHTHTHTHQLPPVCVCVGEQSGCLFRCVAAVVEALRYMDE